MIWDTRAFESDHFWCWWIEAMIESSCKKKDKSFLSNSLSCKHQAFNTSQWSIAKHFAKHGQSLIMLRKAISVIQRGKSCWEMKFLESSHTLLSPLTTQSVVFYCIATNFLNPLTAETVCRFMLFPYYIFPLMKLLSTHFAFQAYMVGSFIPCIIHHRPESGCVDQWSARSISKRGHEAYTARLVPEENANLTEVI